MDFFSGTNPDLISNKVLKEINKSLIAKPVDVPILPSLGDNMSSFYSNYIQPNLFPIIVFVLITIYLFIKYVLKRDKDEKKNDNYLDDIFLDELSETEFNIAKKNDDYKKYLRQKEKITTAIKKQIDHGYSDMVPDSDNEYENNDIDNNYNNDYYLNDHYADPFNNGIRNPFSMNDGGFDGKKNIDNIAKKIFGK